MAKLISPVPIPKQNNWKNIIGALLKAIDVPVPWEDIPIQKSNFQEYIPTPTSTPTPTPTPTPVSQGLDFNSLMEIMAQKAQAQGFNQAVPVSQMAAESERGKSRRAIEDKNMFGLAVYNNDSPGLKFKTPEESMDYYLNLVATDPRYAEAYQQRMDPNAYLDALLRIPYATDPNYKNMITNTPEYRKYSN